MTLTQITEKGIKDGEILNADINASAAIAGSKISPDFGSQAISTTGTGSTLGRLRISNVNPFIELVDTNNNSDFSIRGASGNFVIRDDTNAESRILIDSTGKVAFGTDTPYTYAIATFNSSNGIVLQGGTQSRLLLRHSNAGANLKMWDVQTQNGAIRFRSLDDNTTATDRMVIDGAGRVIIGTTTAANNEKVRIEGRTIDGSSTTIDLDGTGTSGPLLEMRSSSSSANQLAVLVLNQASLKSAIGCGRANAGNWGTDLRFYTHKNATSNQHQSYEHMRIDADGNILIGTTTANKRLTLIDHSDPVAMVIGENLTTTQHAALRLQSRNSANSSGYNLDVGVEGNNAYGYLKMGNTKRMVLEQGGDIGLLTENPNLTGWSAPTVSIGKSANPYSVLEMQGNITSDGAVGVITAYNSGGSSRIGQMVFARQSANNSGCIKFETTNAGNTGERARITNDGLCFHGDSAAANALDDYEHGTYTPNVLIAGGTSGVTQPATRTGAYSKIGERVFFNIHITGTLSYTGSIYHGLEISLPFSTSSHSYSALTVWFYAGVTDEHKVISRTQNNDNKLILQYPGDSIAFLRVDGSWNMMIAGHYVN
tara:strand:+ start:2154 stop:3944 length:1791 start_codon:yes stop_codon:yes gene_type:complete